ncbi:response regulator transcription factor [Dactylosporangium roseum]|uniref:Response regulator transcription factor n=1 Tax=Dactylosporangium roseum TaxID=47989 RepID=A0ABY5YXI5_9ACTN|nr:response regulator transcription factor [Dactylosporangium roseum]UWZ34465.1 response regulator transcription factor [Dactylosporangium roseum]
MTRVLIVDDQALVRAGLAALINAAPDLEVVGQACDGLEAVALAASTRPDVLLMDIRMPVLDGVMATERILHEAGGNPCAILILTTFDLDEYVYAALCAGASGFLLKESPPERLLAAIHTVAAGEMLFAASVTRRLVEAYAQQSKAHVDIPADLSALTAREAEVLRLVARGMTNGEIAEHLTVSEATVKTHLNRSMAKLNLSSRAQAVVVAYETGLVTPQRSAPAGGPSRP